MPMEAIIAAALVIAIFGGFALTLFWAYTQAH